MLKYYANDFKLIRSKIGKKIATLVFIQIIFIIASFIILTYYQSQTTYLGNSINIAGKNRFLTSNLMYQVSEYLFEDTSKTSSQINSAIDQLESNILVLRQGGTISDTNLKPLPSEFLDDWNIIYQKWVSLKTILTNDLTKSSEKISPITVTIVSPISTAAEIDKGIKDTFESSTLSLIDSSNVLATKLGGYVKNSVEYSLFLQRLFSVLNILVTAVFIFYIIRKILKPIVALTTATSEVSRGNLNVSVKSKGHDELAVLSESFNSMITSIKNYIKKQNELKKEIEKTNEELKHKDQLKDEFIQVAAHELRSPIQPILGLSELLQRREIGDSSNIGMTDTIKEEEKEIIDAIIRNSKRLVLLTEDILDVAKIESKSLSLKKEKFNLIEMIKDVLKEYEHQIQNSNSIKLSFETPEINEIIIEGDKNRLSRVFYNLLNNAIRFTKKGSITVNVERKTNNIIISIKDTGIGIPPELLPKLFTKFATDSQTGSTGLGLFISKRIIEMHGGRIWAINNISNGESKGSTFAFSLPLIN
jgi:signal transduction histidine kinase